jgi:hypothetical protein
MKHVYFWQTTCYGGCQASSRLLPIAQWLQWWLVFMAVDDKADPMKNLAVCRAPPTSTWQESIGNNEQ